MCHSIVDVILDRVCNLRECAQRGGREGERGGESLDKRLGGKHSDMIGLSRVLVCVCVCVPERMQAQGARRLQ